MASIAVDSTILFDICSKLMDGHVAYGLGSKASGKTEPDKITKIDCSGFVKYVIYKATAGQVAFEGGSEWQADQCVALNLEKVDYTTAGEFDGWLRIAFIKYPRVKGAKSKVGHVWLVHNGETLESHSGVGPDRRPWDTAKLKNDVTSCYKLSQLFAIAVGGTN